MADRPDKDLTGLRELLKARGHVHTCADAHLLVRALDGTEVYNRFARLDTDPHREYDPTLLLAVCPPDAAPGDPEGPMRVVRVRNRSPEESVNGIADVLLNDPALSRNESGQ